MLSTIARIGARRVATFAARFAPRNCTRTVYKLSVNNLYSGNYAVPHRKLCISRMANQSNPSPTPEKVKEPFSRLPTNVVPSVYDLKLTPNIKEFTFKGSLKITVNVTEATPTIVLNSAEIVIQEAVYTTADGTTLKPTVTLNEDDEKATFTFDAPLTTGEGTLSMEYTGTLNDRMKGFYRSKYTTPDGETRYAATTQFEATDARRAFPCWDEPAIKAKFDVTLVVPSNRVALSNMPVVKEEALAEDESCKVVTFQRSPIMSTYLLAFIIGEYEYIEEKDADGVLVRVYTPMGKAAQGRYALDVAVKTLPFYKEYFGIPYPLPKMDLIAIADFAAGAMENWGLVTYRETALLVDPVHSSMATKMWVALVVGHELAHQWFGNLVTMEWWTHLWLNEGFASFIEYLCVDYCFPEFQIWTQFVSQDMSRGLKLDGMNSSHPIEVPVGHPKEVDEIFDVISYSKGSCIIRMLHDWMGDAAFRKGMNAYLTKHQYKNTLTEDLWEALGEASSLPVQDVMSSWTSQMGYPVISVSGRQEGDTRVLSLSQQKFCVDGKKPEEPYLWSVPMKFAVCGKDAVTSYLLKEETGEVVIPNVQEGDVIKVNPGFSGFYHVLYDSPMLQALAPKMHSLSDLDRLNLINDSFALAKAGLSPVVDALKLTQSFKGETNYTIWSELVTNLSTIEGWVRDTDFSEEFKQFYIDLLGKIVDTVGWEKESEEGPLVSMVRALVLGKMGSLGHQPTVQEAQKRLDRHLSGEASLPADLRNAVYGTVIKNGPSEYFDKMMEAYDKAEMHEEKNRIGRCLGATKDPAQIDQVLNFALSDKVRSQDLPFVVGSVTGTTVGQQKAWLFYTVNQAQLIKMYQGGFLLQRVVQLVTSGFTNVDDAEAIKEFMTNHPAPASERVVDQSLENIRINAAMKARDSDSVKAFLLDQ